MPRNYSAKLLLLLICGSTFALAVCHADEIPHSILGTYRKKVPICEWYGTEDRYKCQGFKYDTISIQRKSVNSAYVGIDLLFANGNVCNFYGVGIWRDGKLVANAKSKESDAKCQLVLTFDIELAKITDVGEQCDRNFCSSPRGAFEGVELPRSEKN